MFFKKLAEIFSKDKRIKRETGENYPKILRESGLLQKIEKLKLEVEGGSEYKLYPCYKELSIRENKYVYDYNSFDRESPLHEVSLGRFYFRIRIYTDGIYLSFRDIQREEPITRKKIKPAKISEKEILKWFSLLKRYSK